MTEISGSSDGIRTIVFPSTIRTVRQESFGDIQPLWSATLNEGLEVLGTEHSEGAGPYYGVFQFSAIHHVKLPSTLKEI